MGAGSVLGKDIISELIKSFSKLSAATEVVPHPDWSDVHPTRPLLLSGVLQQALGLAVHPRPAPVAGELSHATCGGIACLGF